MGEGQKEKDVFAYVYIDEYVQRADHEKEQGKTTQSDKKGKYTSLLICVYLPTYLPTENSCVKQTWLLPPFLVDMDL